MNGHQIDELLKRKVDSARRGRALRTAVSILVLLAIIALIASAIHRHNAKAVSAPDVPSTVETDTGPLPGETDEDKPSSAQSQKPLQPEEMRRKENRHELAVEWIGVPEEELPPIVTVRVLHQGEEVARFTLSEESEWRHSWADDYPSESLTLRADLPKSVMASFVLRGNQFIVTASGGSAVLPSVPTEADSGEGETPDGETEPAEDGGEASDGEAEAPEGEADEPIPGAESGKPVEAESEDKDGGEAEKEADESEEISESGRSGHRWWPIVLLMVCCAVLVTLGMFGIDHRRSR